ncbi:hypothetical protein MMC08_007773 [Hypocenomyce scalaris]|nr:hypothetical protein [Hypocenomyce scalaris]
MSVNIPTAPRLIIHGGAGNITRANLPPSSYTLYASTLLHINRSTTNLLARGAPALDAATHAVSLLEDSPLFNCGKGAVFARNGTIELEASVMVSRGYRKRGCGIMLIKHVKNPIKLAREMLVRGEVNGGGTGSGGSGGAQGHCQLSGEMVEDLGREWGLEMVGERYFWTRKRWEEHKKGLEAEGKWVVGWGEKVAGMGDVGVGDGGWDGHEYLSQGTVGCVVLDAYGTLCVATSTGGLTNKLPGRIGDTPTLGAGFWAEQWAEPSRSPLQQRPPSLSVAAMLPLSLRHLVEDCVPGFARSVDLSQNTTFEGEKGLREEKHSSDNVRAVAMSGTGNGDSFLRLAAVRTAAAIARFSPCRSLSSAVTQIAGLGGELQQSAGDRWGKTGEGEGGIIGIELVNGKGKIVFDFNCGGMFRTFVGDDGKEIVMVFKDKY